MIDPVVDLATAQRSDRVVFADVRYYLDGRSGRDAYDAGHIPGAVFVDVDHDLARHGAPPTEGRHPLPDPELFATRMSTLGISDQDLVIGYDDSGGVMAARLVWMLRAAGHEAALLDGGLSAYPGDLEKDPPRRPPALFTARPWPAERLASIDDADGGGFLVLDARQAERFSGETEPIDPRARAHPRRSQRPLPGERRARRPPPAEGRPAGALRGGRRDRRGRRHLLLRLGRDRLPQPAGDGACRAGRGQALPGLMVGVQPHR